MPEVVGSILYTGETAEARASALADLSVPTPSPEAALAALRRKTDAPIAVEDENSRRDIRLDPESGV